jgi:alpha-D-ribose 1-methylphosphonate 5-triphosphate synthase subunit PhnH
MDQSQTTTSFFLLLITPLYLERQIQITTMMGKLAFYSLGLGLTDAQDTAYTLALKTLWESTTGLTLP